MFMRVSARLQAIAAPDAPAPMMRTSTGSFAVTTDRVGKFSRIPPPPAAA